MSYIYFNNIDSRDFDLKIENIINIPTIEEEFETIEVDGGDNLTISKGYKDIELSFNFAYKANNSEFNKIKMQIDKWLNSKGKYLYYSLTEEIMYKVVDVKVTETKTTSKIVRRFTATFTCKGLKYLRSGLDTINIIENNKTLFNWGTCESEPVLKIYGSGNVSIAINNISFIVKNINEYVVINSEMKECYKENINMGKYMAGNYPVFFIGKNNINWTGNITKVEIIPNWRCL